MNNCFQVTVLSWLLHLGQHLYKITQIYKNMTGNTFTNVLTFCKNANGLIWLFLDVVHDGRHSTTLLIQPQQLRRVQTITLRLGVSEWRFYNRLQMFISHGCYALGAINKLTTRTTVYCRKCDILQ